MPIPIKKLKNVCIELAKNGCNVTAACEKWNISRQSFYVYRKKYKWVAESFDASNNAATDMVRSSLYKTALEGNVVAQIFWLKNKAREEFSDIQRVRNENPNDVRAQITEMSPEEREEYKKTLIAKLSKKRKKK